MLYFSLLVIIKGLLLFVYNLNKVFALKDLGELSYFLGIQVSKLPNGSLHLSHKKYVTNLLSRAKMQSAKSMDTRITSGQRLSAYGSDPFHDSQLYRSIAGALQYATTRDQKLPIVLTEFVCKLLWFPIGRQLSVF